MSRDIYFYTGGETKLQTPRFLAEIGYEMRNPTENDSQDLHVLLNTAFKDLPSHYEGARNQSFVQNLFKDKCFLWECSWLLFTETLAAACLLKRDEPSFLVYTIVEAFYIVLCDIRSFLYGFM